MRSFAQLSSSLKKKSMLLLSAFKTFAFTLCLSAANAKFLTTKDFMTVNSTRVLASAPNCSKVMQTITHFNGTKKVTTVYLKDTADPNSELKKLNLFKFDEVYMLNEESIVVKKPDPTGKTQLFYGKINATDDELQQVTHFVRDTGSFRFNSATKKLYYEMATTDPVKRDDNAVFTFYNASGVRSMSDYLHPDTELIHLFVSDFSINDGNMTISNGTDIFAKFDKTYNVDGYAIGNDGKWIAFKAPGNDLVAPTRDVFKGDLFIFPTNMTQQPFKISDTASMKSQVDSFFITPNGTKIVWSVAEASNINFKPGYLSYDIDSHTTKPHLKYKDYDPMSMAAISDNVFVFTSRNNLTSKLYSYDMATGNVTRRTGDDIYVDINRLIMNGTKLIVTVSNLLTPPELAIIDTNTWEMKNLSNVNTEFMSQFEMHSATRFSFPGWNNETVTGWLHKPAGFDPSKKYPAIVMSHGGPNNEEWTNRFYADSWNEGVYAANGYFVIAVNFHGSPGHGKKFMESIYGQWGGNAYEDIIKGLDYALQQNPQIDPKRVCAMGASFGGYMTNWLSVKSPERFACFITHAGLFDLTMSYLTMGTPQYYNDQQLRQPGSDFIKVPDFSKYSPSKYTKNWAKPMLISHGGKDVNVPTDQGLAAFTALQYSNITSKFLLFPTEAHIVADPPNIIVQINTYLDWLNNYTKV